MILQVHYDTARLLLDFARCLFSPGIVYPSAVRNLSFTVDGDREKREEFEDDVAKIQLSWKPSPGRETHWCTHSPENLYSIVFYLIVYVLLLHAEADLATGYRVTVFPTGRSSHCPDHNKAAEFIIPKVQCKVDVCYYSCCITALWLPMHQMSVGQQWYHLGKQPVYWLQAATAVQVSY